MVQLGDAARKLRSALGITQRAAAKQLGISAVHLCNVESNKASPSPELLDKISATWGIDLYVYAWCLGRDDAKLPKSVREVAARLRGLWEQQIEETAKRRQRQG